MTEFQVACPNPFDGRLSAVRIRLDGEDEPWCNVDFLQAAVRRAFTGAGLAWWDSRCVYCSQPGQICEVPWFGIQASEIGIGVLGYAVPVEMDLVDVSIADRTATLAPKGYPPNVGFYLSEERCATVRERMQINFGRDGALSPEDIEKIYRAFRTVYLQALVKDRIHLRCASGRCGDGETSWVTLCDPSPIRLCPLFFMVSEAYAASAIIEELLHGYLSISHSAWAGRPLPPVDEADTYQRYILAHYLTS